MKSRTTVVALLLSVASALASAAASPSEDSLKAIVQARDLINSSGSNREPLERADRIIADRLAADPNDYRALVELGRLYIASGYQGSRYASYHGHVYIAGDFEAGALAAARQALDKSIRIAPEYGEAYVVMGHLLMIEERFGQASDALQKAERLGADASWLDIYRGNLHDARAELPQAEACWQKVIDSSKDPYAINAAYHHMIHLRQSQGRIDDAASLYKVLLARRPEDAWTLGNYAAFLHEVRRDEEAIATARAALALSNYGAVRRTLAMSLYGRWAQVLAAGNPAEAEKYFKEAQSIHPDLDSVMANEGSQENSADIVTALKARNIAIDARNETGDSALQLAVNRNQARVVKTLLSLGANPNVRGSGGWTPLLSAADEGNEEIVRALLAAGADRDTNVQGRTAIGLALRSNPALAQLIADYRTTDASRAAPPAR